MDSKNECSRVLEAYLMFEAECKLGNLSEVERFAAYDKYLAVQKGIIEECRPARRMLKNA